MSEDTAVLGAEDPQPQAAMPVAPKVSLIAGQPAAVIGTAVAVAEALLASPAIPFPDWLKAILALLIALAGAFGIYSKVTPVANPKLDPQTPLTP